MKKIFTLLIALLMATLSSWAQTTNFESFSAGTVNYQGIGGTTVTGAGYIIPSPYGSLWTVADEWGFTGSFDQEVKDDGSGNKVWRFSNALTSGGYSNQPNSPSSALPAGESTASLWNDRGPNHTTPVSPPLPRANAATKYFHGGFKFKSATGTGQAGLTLTINPIPRQTDKRMSFVNIADNGTTGFNLIFYETLAGGTFSSAIPIASNLSYSDWHQLDIYIEFVDGLNGDGTGNDEVTVMLNGTVIKTGTTWETYFASIASTASPSPVAVDALMFRASGTAVPATLGNGLYFDDVTVDNAQVPGPVNVYTDNTLTTLVSNHNTINEAIIAPTTLPGYVIDVAAGTYTENLNVTKSVTIRGANYGINPNSATWNPNPSRVAESVIEGTVVGTPNGFTLDGFTLKANVLNSQMITLSSSGSLGTVTVANNIISGEDLAKNALFSGKEVTYNINNNTFRNFTVGTSFVLYPDGNNLINSVYSGNLFTNNTRWGIIIGGSVSGSQTITGNKFDQSATAIILGSGGHSITDNIFTNSGGAIYSSGSGGNTITGNTFTNTSTALSLAGSGSGDLFNSNNVLGGNVSGISINNTTGNTLNATCNWWGTTDAAAIASKISGGATSVPYNISQGGECVGGLPIITTIETPTSDACGTLDVDVTVQDFNVVGAISLKLNYDPTKLQLPIDGLAEPPIFDGITLNSAISDAAVGADNTIGLFSMAHFLFDPAAAVTLDDDAVLFTLHFNILPAAAGGSNTDLAWSTVSQDCEYAGPAGTPTYTGTFNNKPITIPAWPVRNVTQNLGYCNIQSAVIAANSNDEIEVSAGTFTETGQIVIDKNLTINGAGIGLTTVKPAQNTGNSSDARGWFLVNAGITFNLSNLTLDGSDKLVYQGIRQKGVGTIDHVEFKNIKYNESGPDYSGIAVAAFGNGNVHITNSSFEEIGRVGVLYYGAGITGSNFHANTYTGKGTGNWLDYMLDISAGAVVDVQGCTVSGNRGVASSDNSTSAGIIVTTYFGDGTKATITGCTITDNTTGINVGYNASDLSIVKAENNKIYGNEYGVTSTNPVVDASPNWWGDATGPYNTPYNVCGLGNDAEGNVTFRPWYTDAAMTTLSAAPLAPVVSIPATMASTVECVASATAPTALPEVIDFCGTVLTPTGPAMSGTYVDCEGTVIYTYTYTDVLGGSLEWTYTYTIDRTTAPVVPANSSKTVACPADAVNPALLATIPDQQQLLVATNLTTPNWTNFTSIGQSFTCGTSGWLTKLDLRVGSIAAAQNFTLQIYQGNGIAGTLLYTGSHSLTATGWQSLNIAQELAPYLTAGTQYTFWLTSFTYNQLGLLCMYPNVYNGGVSMDGCTSGCSPTYAWQQWPDYDLVFKTYMTAVPIVKDVCGTVIPTPEPVLTDGTYIDCEGTKLYTYTYTDCAGNSTPWVFTYNIERNDFTMPANTTATVACVSNVVVPTPPAVNDNCGNALTPVPGTAPDAPDCEGTMVYTWTYTDCEGNSKIWTHTVTIDDNIAPVFTTCAPAVTVNVNSECYYIGSIGTPVATDNCSGTVNYTNDVPVDGLPVGTNTVTWTATDCAGNAATCQQIVTVVKNTVSGTLVYNNAVKTKMNLVKMVIKDATNTQVGAEVTTTSAGAFTFPDLCAGTYTIHVTYNAKDAGGINATDAAQVNKWSTNYGDIEHVKFLAGDVTNSKFITSDDALKIQGYFVFPGNINYAITPKWSYWIQGELITDNEDPYPSTKPWPEYITVTVTDDVTDFDLYGMLTGDFDGSLVPEALKSANPSLTLAENSNLQVGANQAFELPLRAASAMQVGAVSMILDIPSELVTIQNVKMKGSNEPVMWAISGNELRIGWHSLNPVNVAENGALVTLELMTTSAFAQGQTLDIALPFNPLNELADGNFEAMEYAELMVAKVGNQAVGNIAIDKNGGLLFSNYPNPFSKVTTLEYSLPVDGKVTLSLYNNVGQLVTVLVDADQMAGQHTFRYESNTLQPGIYVAKLRLVNNETDMVGTIKLSVQK
jgi:parallel beta-helix repeat protein